MRLTKADTQMTNDEVNSLKYANAWINTKPIFPQELKGKTVLIEFGTYTCINWMRTLPYIRAWESKYKENGLVVIVVHTPEFSFERAIANVKQSIKEMGIGFPVAVDNNYDIWNAFHNSYWPALYFIDAKGKIRHHQFGEGNYEKSEKIIQKLLAEADQKNIDDDLVTANGAGAEAAPDFENLNSGENYLGYERTENFSSPENVLPGMEQTYHFPVQLNLNAWALAGKWYMNDKLITSFNPDTKVIYRFHARDLHLVMGPAKPGTFIRFRVFIDGKSPGAAHGIDVDEFGNGIVSRQRMYQLIRQPVPVQDREFLIEFLDPGIEVFSFTFG